MNRDILVFDLGETLLNFNKNHQIWRDELDNIIIPQWFHTLTNHQESSLEEFQKLASEIIKTNDPNERQTSITSRIEKIITKFQWYNDQPTLPEALGSWEQIFYHTLQSASLYQDTIPTLQALQKQGKILSLFSDTPWQCHGSLIERLMKTYEIYEYFDSMFFSGDLEIRKPDPRTLEHIRREKHYDPGRMIYIGNQARDIEVASNFKIPSVWINRTGNPLPGDWPVPDYEIEELSELVDILKTK